MFDVISKDDYFAALSRPELHKKLQAVAQTWDMKHVQDAWVLSQLDDVKEAAILVLGGGHTRLLRCLDPSNRMVNLDTLEDLNGHPNVDRGEVVIPEAAEVRPAIADDSFDYIVSVSVMHHVPASALPAYWAAHARALKPGGLGVHAVDVYVGDEWDRAVEARLNMYLDTLSAAGLRLARPKTIVRPLMFRSWYASCADYCMWMWNNQAPSLKERRSTHQCVSLKLVVTR